MIAPVRNARSINRLRRTDPVQEVTAYATYPFRDPESMISPFNSLVPGGSTWSKAAKQTADSVKEWLQNSSAAKQAAEHFLSAQSTAWQERTVVSSNSRTVTASAAAGAFKREYLVQVSSLACAQRNESYSLARSASSLIDVGTHHLSLAINGKNHTVSLSITARDTNEQALLKFKQAIQSAELGVQAAVRADSKAGTVRLELQADQAGAAHSFRLTDLTGNAVASTGISIVVQEASDTLYSINHGELQHTTSNIVRLDSGKVTITLHQTTQDAVRIKVDADANAVARQLRSVLHKVNQLNDVYDTAVDFLNPELRTSVDQALSGSAASRIGIEKARNGDWLLDEQKLATAVSNNSERVNRELGGGSGIIANLSKSITRVEQMPAQSLMNPATQAMQHLTLYQATMQPYWQMPSSGWYMNGMG